MLTFPAVSSIGRVGLGVSSSKADISLNLIVRGLLYCASEVT